MPTPLIFTVCTLNYLPYAQAFYEQLRQFEPNCTYVVGIVDDLPQPAIRPANFAFELLAVTQLKISFLPDMVRRYTIFDLVCALKPYFADYLFEHYPQVEKIAYFDTDMLVFSELSSLWHSLNGADIVLTPHVQAPFDDGKHQHERNFLSAGIYNAGFFALRRSEAARQMLVWWKKHTEKEGLLRPDLGLFNDQNWLNFVPIFFKNVLIERHLGYNVGYWNLQERHLSLQNGRWLVNQQVPLVFYHFSGFNITTPNVLSKHQNRYSFELRPDVLPLYEQYKTLIEKHKPLLFRHFRSVYDQRYLPKSLSKHLLELARKVLRFALYRMLNWVERKPDL